MVRGEGEVYRAPSHPVQALLGASQTAFCARPRQAAGLVPRCLIISTDNTNHKASWGSIMWSHGEEPFCLKPAPSPPELQRLRRRGPATGGESPPPSCHCGGWQRGGWG